MSYRDYTTKQVITITPDKVFQKMMKYVSLLPGDASAWEFCLPWIYFQALTIGLQEDLRDSGYILPPPYQLLTKNTQVRAMTLCRDEARTSYKRMKDLQRQVERVVCNNTTKRNVKTAFEDHDYQSRIYDHE